MSDEGDGERETEGKILDAAHAVFVRRGTAGARMKEIADEAGVNKALLHYYFRTKSRLAAAVFERAAAELLPPVLGELVSDHSIEQKVERVVRLELSFLSDHPYLPGYVLSELNHHPERASQLVAELTGRAPEGVAERIRRTLGRQLEEAARSGELRSIAPEQFVVNLIALCIFPFAARPMIAAVLGLDDDAFEAFIERREKELPRFFMEALRP